MIDFFQNICVSGKIKLGEQIYEVVTLHTYIVINYVDCQFFGNEMIT